MERGSVCFKISNTVCLGKHKNFIENEWIQCTYSKRMVKHRKQLSSKSRRFQKRNFSSNIRTTTFLFYLQSETKLAMVSAMLYNGIFVNGYRVDEERKLPFSVSPENQVEATML